MEGEFCICVQKIFVDKCNKLMKYVYRNDLERLKKRAKNHPEEINQKNSKGWTALMMATANINKYSCIEAVEILLEYGADPNLKNDKGKTALHCAAKYAWKNRMKAEQLVILLIKNGANVNLENNRKKIPLNLAIEYGEYDKNNWYLIGALLEHGSNIYQEDDKGRTIIEYLIDYGIGENIELLEKFLQLDEKYIFYSDDTMESIIDLCVDKVNPNYLERYLEYGPVDKIKRIPLVLYRMNNPNLTKEIIEILAKYDKSGEIIDQEGNTVFHYLSEESRFYFGKEESFGILKILLEKYQKYINYVNNKGKTALSLAINSYRKKFAKLLIENGANLNFINNQEFVDNLFNYPNRVVNPDIPYKNEIDILLENSFDINQKDSKNKTILYHIVKKWIPEDSVFFILEKMINYGLNLNEKMDGGYTILHFMAETNPDYFLRSSALDSHQNSHINYYCKYLNYFLIRGADINQKNDNGEIPYDIAIKNNNMLTAHIMLEKGYKDEIKKLKRENKRLKRENNELFYQPENPGYQKAMLNFESLKK